MAMHKAAVVEVGVFRDDSIAVAFSVRPHLWIRGRLQAQFANVSRVRINSHKKVTQSWGEVLIRAKVSRRYREKTSLTIGGEGQACTQIIMSQVREVGEDLRF